MNTENITNAVKYLIDEYEEEKKLRIKYQKALETIEYSQDEYSGLIIRIARNALNSED